MSQRRGVLWLLLGMLLAGAVLLRGTVAGPLIGSLLIVSLGLLFVRDRLDWDRSLGVVLFGALLVRLLVIALDLHLGLFPKADAVVYHFRASALAEAWWGGEPWQVMNNLKTASYEIFIAPLYFWFGTSPLLARTFNAVLATLATYNIFRIGDQVFDRRAGLIGAGAFALLPTFVRVHGEHLREALIVLLVTQVVYLLVADRFDRPVSWLLLAGCMGLLVFARRPTFLVLLFPIGLAVLRRLRETGSLKRVAVTAAPVLGAVLVGAALWAWLQGGNLFYAERLSPEQLSDFRRPWATGGSGYLTDVVFESWWDVISFLPVGAIYFLLVPFPWQLNNALALAALAENLLFYYPLVLAALPTFRASLRDRNVAILAVFIVMAALLYGLIEGNVGTVLRHRAQFTWVLFLFAGKTISDWWTERPDASADIDTEREREIEMAGA